GNPPQAWSNLRFRRGVQAAGGLQRRHAAFPVRQGRNKRGRFRIPARYMCGPDFHQSRRAASTSSFTTPWEKTMPTPVDLLLDPLTWTLLAMFIGLGAWEALAPGRELPRVRGWTARALTSFLVYFLLSSYLPLLWGEAL